MPLFASVSRRGRRCTTPPLIRRPNLAEFAELVCRIVRFLNFADLFCRITRFLGLCRLVLPTCWGLWVLGHLSWRHPLLWDCIIPFLCTLVVQIGTMQCFYCPQKENVSVICYAQPASMYHGNACVT